MKHYAITLPENDDNAEAVVQGLQRGINDGLVFPHTPADAELPIPVTAGSVLEFDSEDPDLARVIELTGRQAEKPGSSWSGFKAVVTEVAVAHNARN
jgi:hypothetical protein